MDAEHEVVANSHLELHLAVHKSLSGSRRKARELASNETLSNFTEEYFVLVAGVDFSAIKKLAVHWQGRRGVIRLLSDYV